MTPFFTSLHSTFHVARSMFNVLSLLLFTFAGTRTAQAQPPAPSDNPSNLINLPAGKFLWWYGYTGRTYFIQVSDIDNPLGKWNWAPIIEAGNNAPISYEVDGTASKKFFRLKPTDLPIPAGKTIDTADFDQDGISNLDEIVPPTASFARSTSLSSAIGPSQTSATDPLNPDTDGDGMNDGFERENGFDPNNPDENGNGTPDGADDSDGDGVSNVDEINQGTDPADAEDTAVAEWFVLTGDSAQDVVKS